MESLRIFHVITRMGRGGAPDALRALAREQGRAGHAVTVVSGEFDDRAPVPGSLDAGDFAPIHVPMLVRDVSPLCDLRALLELRRVFAEGRPDVVHTHTSKAGILGRSAAWLAGVPAVVHSPHGPVFRGYFNPVASDAVRMLETLVFPLHDALAAVSPSEARVFARLPFARAERIAVIPFPSGPDEGTETRPAQRAAARARLGIPPGGPVVGSVTRLVSVKGLESILFAGARLAQRIPDLRILLAGDGPERGALETLARRLGIADRLVLPGWLEDPSDGFAALDLFLLTSKNEGMSLSLIQAMKFGIPTVSFAVGGLPDLVCDGLNGHLVPPGDLLGLVETVAALLGDPERAARIADEARRRADRIYSAERSARRFLDLYERVLAPRRDRGRARQATPLPRMAASMASERRLT